MADVRAMLAIGMQGQLGNHGVLPWEGNTDPAFVEDVERFFELTRGHVLIAGPVTARSVPDWAKRDLEVFELRSHMAPEDVIARFEGRRIFVGGGPTVWAAYAPYIRIWDVTRLPYDGPADRYFDPAWMLGPVRI
ncbi:diacylglycerol kinase [Chthonobacter albigriseus]|uniref:diacylglycerol kinase n=1 Tax=Chthonobacter albigriseus TaxID=1683161 RepID=UPI0015EEFB1D|nr:diacylglycerol kinase [Chthonobacter albigriseus]